MNQDLKYKLKVGLIGVAVFSPLLIVGYLDGREIRTKPMNEYLGSVQKYELINDVNNDFLPELVVSYNLDDILAQDTLLSKRDEKNISYNLHKSWKKYFRSK